MEGLGHILTRLSTSLDPNPLDASSRAALDGDGRPRTTEVTGDKSQKLCICLAVHRWRLQMRKPHATFNGQQQADSRPWLDLHLNEGGWHLLGVSRRASMAARSQAMPYTSPAPVRPSDSNETRPVRRTE